MRTRVRGRSDCCQTSRCLQNYAAPVRSAFTRNLPGIEQPFWDVELFLFFSHQVRKLSRGGIGLGHQV